MAYRSLPALVVLAVMPFSLAAQESLTRPAEPAGRTGAIITTADYPDESLRRNEQGMTTVEYQIDETGRVTPGSCKVTATSRYRRLDERTCRIIETRFRFTPALEDGKPVREMRTQSIFWRVPGEVPEYDLVDVAIRKVHSYGGCLSKDAPELARRIVDAPLGSEEQKVAVAAVDGAKLKCWYPGDSVKAPPTLLAGAIAEHIVENQYGPTGALLLSPEGAGPVPRNGTEGLAQCIARRNPANVQELLATTPTGPAESVAVRKIVPDLSPCVMAGTTLRFNKVSMRTLLAIGLYREATAAAIGTAGTGKPQR